jgi:peroxiredoxin
MLGSGDQLPDVEVWTPSRERVSLRTLAGEGTILLLFYLFDWSAT